MKASVSHEHVNMCNTVVSQQMLHPFALHRQLLIRLDEVLSRITNVAILKVADHALGVLLQHRHVVIGRFA